MNLFFILLLVALIAAGYYVYQRLLTIEREIRAEQGALIEEDVPIVPDSAPQDVEASTDTVGVKDRVMSAVEETPGLAQTELYAKFPDEDRRLLQKLLRELDQAGKLRREKKGSSYRLYPL